MILSEEVLASVKQAIEELENEKVAIEKTLEDLQKEKEGKDSDLFALKHLLSRHENEKIISQNVSFDIDNSTKW